MTAVTRTLLQRKYYNSYSLKQPGHRISIGKFDPYLSHGATIETNDGVFGGNFYFHKCIFGLHQRLGYEFKYRGCMIGQSVE